MESSCSPPERPPPNHRVEQGSNQLSQHLWGTHCCSLIQPADLRSAVGRKCQTGWKRGALSWGDSQHSAPLHDDRLLCARHSDKNEAQRISAGPVNNSSIKCRENWDRESLRKLPGKQVLAGKCWSWVSSPVSPTPRLCSSGRRAASPRGCGVPQSSASGSSQNASVGIRTDGTGGE